MIERLVSRFLILAALMVLFLYARSRASSRSIAGFTEQQMIARTQSLCWLIAPEAGRIVVSADPSEIETPGGRHVRSWTVECSDIAGNPLACFVWNADTSELMSAARRKSPQPGNSTGPMDRKAAVRTAKQWMRSLSISATAPQWRLRSEPERVGDSWHIPWQADDRMASIAFNARTGSLNMAHCWRARAPRV
jgi:hypothetical protein